VLHGPLFPELPVHIGFEEANGSAALALGTVERGVGVAQQCRLFDAVRREYRDPNADAHAQAMSADVDLVGNRGEQLFAQRRYCDRSDTQGRDDIELITAEARQKGFPRDAFEACRNLAQQRVARRMTEDVVDLLEAVDVDTHDREGVPP